MASCWESLILSSPKAWVRARLLSEAAFVHLTILWALGLGLLAHRRQAPPILDATLMHPRSRKDDRRRRHATREDDPSNVPKAHRECEVHTVCFSIYGTLGEPHLALSMSSLMYSRPAPAGAHRRAQPQGKVCVSLSGSTLGKVGEIPLFLGWIPLLILFGPHSVYAVGAIPGNLKHWVGPTRTRVD